MQIDRSIRSMTPQEKQAKREWGTGACQVRGCTTRAAYLVLETSSFESESGDWWQYCCPKHALQFANQHGLEMPAQAAFAGQDRETAPIA
ncbi:MAG: hypothetical protein ABSG56_09970 [Bryobacteraceae bacterium]|jgi:hypothetical protein